MPLPKISSKSTWKFITIKSLILLGWYIFYSLGHQKKLPEDWNQIPGAKGCTLENCILEQL